LKNRFHRGYKSSGACVTVRGRRASNIYRDKNIKKIYIYTYASMGKGKENAWLSKAKLYNKLDGGRLADGS